MNSVNKRTKNYNLHDKHVKKSARILFIELLLNLFNGDWALIKPAYLRFCLFIYLTGPKILSKLVLFN